MYLLFTSAVPLSKEIERDIYFFTEYTLKVIHVTCTYVQSKQVKIFVIFQVIYKSIKSHQCLNTTLHFVLSHNALALRRKIIASISLEPLSHPQVIVLPKFVPLSLLKINCPEDMT